VSIHADDRLEAYIQRRGLKQTRQRKLILEVFLAMVGHVSAEQLLVAVQARDAGVGPATVYRTLRLFEEAGIAHVRRFGDGRTLYEPVGDHHDHLLCATCGHIFEFEDEVIEEHQRAVADRYGLDIVSHRHEITGACRRPETCEFNRVRQGTQRNG
jgi:Fur family ferric uptake transcriptional regulator